MQKQLGKIGTVRREIRGKACPLCGGYRYQLLVRPSSLEEASNVLARCSQCGRPRQLDDGFWKNLVDIKIVDHAKIFAKPLAMLQTHRTRKQETKKVLAMLASSGAVRHSDVEFRYSTSSKEAGILARSFAVSLPPATPPSAPFQAACARLQARGIQLYERLRLQERYGRLQLRGIQLFRWLRRELTAFSYFSRI